MPFQFHSSCFLFTPNTFWLLIQAMQSFQKRTRTTARFHSFRIFTRAHKYAKRRKTFRQKRKEPRKPMNEKYTNSCDGKYLPDKLRLTSNWKHNKCDTNVCRWSCTADFAFQHSQLRNFYYYYLCWNLISNNFIKIGVWLWMEFLWFKWMEIKRSRKNGINEQQSK